jgi:hypothetical protein
MNHGPATTRKEQKRGGNVCFWSLVNWIGNEFLLTTLSNHHCYRTFIVSLPARERKGLVPRLGKLFDL